MLRERVGCPVLSSAAGRPIDEKTGLSDYRARFYDPGVGRFISEDPSGFAGGDTNLFRYVGNDPLDRVDPSGLTAKWAGYGGKGSVPAAGWGAYGLLASGAISPANSFTGKSERGVPFVEFLVTRSSSGAITPQSSLPDTRSLSGYDRVSLGVHGTLSIAGAVPFLGIVPDAIDLAYTAAELPFGKSSKTDLAFATAGIAATAAPFIGDGAAAALKMSARVARIGGNTASDVVRVAGRFDDMAVAGNNLVLQSPRGTGIRLATGMGHNSAPMQIERAIARGEQVADLVDETKRLTFTSGNEHAIVKLADGRRVIVSGGPGGIDLPSESVTRVFGHSHPYHLPPTGPSPSDLGVTRTSLCRSLAI